MSVLLIVFNVIVSMVTSVFRSCFAVLRVFSFIFLISEKIFAEFREYVGQCPFLVASLFPDLFLICVMRTFFLLVLVHAIDLIPLNPSRISCIF